MRIFQHFLKSAAVVAAFLCLRLAGAPLLYLDFHTGEGVNPALAGLKKVFPEVETVSVQKLEEEKLSAADGKVLLVSESESFPASAVNGLKRYLRSGGDVIFTGGDRPFTEPSVRDGERFLPPAVARKQLSEMPGRDIGAIKSGQKYLRICAPEIAGFPGTAKISGDGRTLRFFFPNYSGWDSWSTVGDPVKIPADTGMIRLQVRGDCPFLSLELREKNGARWIAPFPVTKQWKTVLLPLGAFKIWQSPKNHGDRVKCEDVHTVFFGISGSHTRGVVPGKSYQIEVRNIEAVTVNGGVTLSYPVFSLEGVSPDYKSYVLPGPMKIETASGKTFDYSGSAVSPVPRMTGVGITMNRPWRFIPLATARNDQGGKGYPVWIMLQLDRGYKGSAVAGIGFALNTILEKPELTAELTGLVKRLEAGIFLAAGGPSDFVADLGQEAVYGAELFHVSPGCKVRGTLKAPDGTVTAFERVTDGAPPKIAAKTKITVPGTYLCLVELLNSEGNVVDSITGELNVPDGRPDPASAFVRTDRDNFVIGDTPFYPNGVNFFPIYAMAGIDGNDYWAGWSSRRIYDPELVDAELRAVKALGLNMISIHPSDVNTPDPMAIRDLLYRCRKHGIRLNLYAGGMGTDPLNFDADRFRTLVDKAHLKNDAYLFCYDIVWEAGNFLFDAQHRKHFLPEWNRWVVRQYGTSEAAVKDWKFDPGRDPNGLLKSPTDAQLDDDGHHRVYVAAYRRFMDDCCHRLWQHAVDRIREIDPNHLLTNRAGNIYSYDNGLTGPVKALDFISPEGYAIRNDSAGEGAVGFVTRYIDYTSGGKPVVWSEFGIRVLSAIGNLPDPNRLKAYPDYDRIIYQRGLESGAQGFAPWWWPGGFRVDEDSDCGIVNVDGSLREIAKMIAAYAPKVKEPRNRRHGKTVFTFDRDAGAGGYREAAFHAGGRAYLAAAARGDMLEIRTPATGKTSVDVPIVGIGNVPYTGTNPVKYLNGAVEKLEYRDASGKWIKIADGDRIDASGVLRLRAKLGNTGEVPFIAGSGRGCVSLRVAWKGHAALFPLESDLPRLRDTRLEFELPADAEGEISLRFDARERAAFGESFNFLRGR